MNNLFLKDTAQNESSQVLQSEFNNQNSELYCTMSIEEQILQHQKQGGNMEDYEQEAFKNKYKSQVKQLISKISIKDVKSRQLLAKSYRKVNAMINRLQNQTLNLNDDPEFLDDTLKSAFFYRAYDLNNPNLKFQTLLCREAICANRRVKAPVVKVAEEALNQPGKSIRINVDSSEFTLKIQSQPHTNIIFTTKPGGHPVLQNQVKPPYEKKYCSNSFVQSMPAPCEVNIVAVSESKIESKVITVKVTTNLNVSDYSAQNIGYAVRPMDSFPFQDSSLIHYQNINGEKNEDDQDM